MRRKKRTKKRPVLKLCDPGMCDHCTYVGEGDFLCDDYPGEVYVIVMSDWEPTEYFLHCMRRHDAKKEAVEP